MQNPQILHETSDFSLASCDCISTSEFSSKVLVSQDFGHLANALKCCIVKSITFRGFTAETSKVEAHSEMGNAKDLSKKNG